MVMKRIELIVSQDFYEAVKLLAESQGIARADVIRKAVSLYAGNRCNISSSEWDGVVRCNSDLVPRLQLLKEQIARAEQEINKIEEFLNDK